MEQNQENLAIKPPSEKETPHSSEIKTESSSASPPTLKKVSKRSLLFIGAFTIFVLIVAVGGWFWWQRTRVSVKREQLPHPVPVSSLPEEVLQLKDEYIPVGEEEIAFLQNGKIRLVSKDLGKRMEYGLTETMETVTSFTFSPSGQKLYWLTEVGEHWRTNERGEINPLVTKERDMVEKTFEDPITKKSSSYLKGKVTAFYLSPEGDYIAYETLEGFTGCCMGPSDIPITSIRIMKNDGTEKNLVEQPLGVRRPLLFFDGWIPARKKILFHFQAADEPTTGSPFFEVGIDGKRPQLHSEIFKYSKEGVEVQPIDIAAEEISLFAGRVIGTEPVYSPTGKKVAYIRNECELRLKDVETEEAKSILQPEDCFPFALASEILNWSKDGSLLSVTIKNKIFVFNSKGEIILEFEPGEVEDLESVISPDNKHLAGVYRKEKERIGTAFFVSLADKKKKEFKLSEPTSLGTFIISPQFILNNRLYYLRNQKLADEQRGGEFENPPPQLWMVDIKTLKNYKVAENVSLVKPYPSAITSEEIKIVDGNIYRIFPSGGKKILIDKRETAGEIWRFYIEPSPVSSKKLLMVLGGVDTYFLYYLPSNNADAKQIGFAEEAVWSNNGHYIAYANKPADAAPITNVFIYDTQNDKKTELSRNHKIESLNYSYLGFSNLRWLDDDSGIQVKYDAYTDEMPYGEKISEGETIMKVKE